MPSSPVAGAWPAAHSLATGSSPGPSRRPPLPRRRVDRYRRRSVDRCAWYSYAPSVDWQEFDPAGPQPRRFGAVRNNRRPRQKCSPDGRWRSVHRSGAALRSPAPGGRAAWPDRSESTGWRDRFAWPGGEAPRRAPVRTSRVLWPARAGVRQSLERYRPECDCAWRGRYLPATARCARRGPGRSVPDRGRPWPPCSWHHASRLRDSSLRPRAACPGGAAGRP